MNADSIQQAREHRRSAWRVAARVRDISDRTGVSPENVSPENLLTLPDWCMEDLQDIRVLQRNCGALYFAPSIYLSIDGELLREFRQFAGSTCFNYIRNSKKIFEHEADIAPTVKHLAVQVMGAGSSVLLSTLQDNEFVTLYERLLGPATVPLDAALGNSLFNDAHFVTSNTQQNAQTQ